MESLYADFHKLAVNVNQLNRNEDFSNIFSELQVTYHKWLPYAVIFNKNIIGMKGKLQNSRKLMISIDGSQYHQFCNIIALNLASNPIPKNPDI